MATGLLAFVDTYDRALGPDPVPNYRLAHIPPENRKPSNHAGFLSGETRTRTGDTTIFMVGLGQFGMLLFVTYYCQRTLGFSAIECGLAFLPWLAAFTTMAQVGT